MGEAKKRTFNIDQQVRLLVDRQKRGEPTSLTEVVELCPYQTVFGLPLGTAPETVNRVVPDVVIAALGFVPEDFSDRMRTDIIAALRAGKVVRLVSNRAELRDYAKREITLAFASPKGMA